MPKKTLSKLGERNKKEREGIETLLGEVQQGNVSFWNPSGVRRELTAQQQEALINAPWSLTAALCIFLAEADLHHRILGRFARLAVFQLSSVGHEAESIAGLLQGIGLDAGLEKIEQFIDSGNKYSHLAKELGGHEVLFFLPMSVPEFL